MKGLAEEGEKTEKVWEMNGGRVKKKSLIHSTTPSTNVDLSDLWSKVYKVISVMHPLSVPSNLP